MKSIYAVLASGILLAASSASCIAAEPTFNELVAKQRELAQTRIQRQINEERNKSSAGSPPAENMAKMQVLVDDNEPQQIDAAYGVGSSLTLLVRTPSGLKTMRSGDQNGIWRLNSVSGNTAMFVRTGKKNWLGPKQVFLQMPGLSAAYQAQ
ncbi:hypothetical protein SAMN06265795_117110 [Noviherbaspirillum humi]|uniref:Type IV pilus biogenesis protein PilP n=1 Tax=Noviherbaspirillum humi TaxID=1688639 RepID=A0A239KUK3_9BURK|nr:hypothetical protein [Noviherbaspirillum humi]SNT22036.1 hypothetical protein SAMN06265795_117110 [Noviherbaspirillum humi]